MGRTAFRDLDAWRQARKLVRLVYRFTDALPQDEKYILGAQMKRAAHSVHLNIAEGQGRLSNGEWQQFLGQARGSLMELESAIIVSYDLRYCTRTAAAEIGAQLKRTMQLVNGLLRASAKGYASKKFKPVNG
jgi:four helix bundle protein